MNVPIRNVFIFILLELATQTHKQFTGALKKNFKQMMAMIMTKTSSFIVSSAYAANELKRNTKKRHTRFVLQAKHKQHQLLQKSGKKIEKHIHANG